MCVLGGKWLAVLRRIEGSSVQKQAAGPASWFPGASLTDFEKQQDACKQNSFGFFFFSLMAQSIIKKVLNRKGTLGGKSA